MIITTTENVSGNEIDVHLGTVIGNTIRARHVGKDIQAAFRTIMGGEIKEYTSMMAESREQALIRMKDSCLLYTSPSPRDQRGSRMPSSA